MFQIIVNVIKKIHGVDFALYSNGNKYVKLLT